MNPLRSSLRRSTRFLLLLGLLTLPPYVCSALSGRGTTAATFLKIGTGPRAVAMGEAFAGVAEDSSAVFWNPAGLAQSVTPEISAMHVFWLQDLTYDHLGGALPAGPGTAGLSLIYLNAGTLARAEAGDTPESPDRGTFGASNFSLQGAYGYWLSPSMALGGGLKLFFETVDDSSSFGWALDLGYLYRLPWAGWTLGAMVQNVGPAARILEEYFRLPINFKVGAAFRPDPRWLLTLDYNQLLEQNGRIAFGAEYKFEENLALRAGYRYQSAIDANEYYEGFGSAALSGISAGLGWTYLSWGVDYAFVPYGLLGSTHRLALTYRFERPAPEPGPVHPPTVEPTRAPTLEPTPIPQPSSNTRQPAAQAGIQEIKRRIAIGQLAQIQFASGSAVLTADSGRTLEEVARWFRQYPDLRLRIEGHTDSQGVADDNLRLSQARVDAVKDFLAETQQIQAGRLEAVGLGQTRPIASNATRTGRAKNRRVEFVILGEEP